MHSKIYTNLKNAVHDFFFKKDVQHFEFLIFFRISIGLFSLLQIFSVWKDFQKLFGKYGIIPSDIQELMLPDYLITLPKIITFFESYGVSEQTTITFFLTLFISCAVTLVLGLYTRISSVLMLLMYVSISSGTFKYGVDSFMTTSLFYLSIFPSGYYFSLDNLIFKNRASINLTPFRRLFQIHVVLAYFFSGIAKCFGINWWNGEAIWKSINLPGSNSTFYFNFSWFAEHPFSLAIIGWSVLMIEVLYPVFIFIPKTRKLWLSLTITMHIGIALVLNLYFFAVIMILWNLTAFYFVSDYKTKSTVLESDSSKEPELLSTISS